MLFSKYAKENSVNNMNVGLLLELVSTRDESHLTGEETCLPIEYFCAH